MKEVLRRVLVVGWIANVGLLIFFLSISEGHSDNLNLWIIPGVIGLIILAIQYIFLGVANPIRLFQGRNKG